MAVTSAMKATTIAGDGRCDVMRRMVTSLLVDWPGQETSEASASIVRQVTSAFRVPQAAPQGRKNSCRPGASRPFRVLGRRGATQPFPVRQADDTALPNQPGASPRTNCSGRTSPPDPGDSDSDGTPP